MTAAPLHHLRSQRCSILAQGAPSQAEAWAMICYINVARLREGRTALRRAAELDAAETERVRAIANCGQFSHTPCGEAFLASFRAAGYARGKWSVGETLGWGTGSLATPQAIVNAWLDSPQHRDILLSPLWRDVGVGETAGRAPPLGRHARIWGVAFGRHN